MKIDWDVDTLADPAIYVDHEAAVQEIRETKRPKEEMFRAALYTYRLCYVTRRVGRGAGQISQKQYADQLGYSPGYITALKRVGRALAFHRVPTGTPLYSTIINNAGRKEFGRVLESARPMAYDDLMHAIAQIESASSSVPQADRLANCEVVLQAAIECLGGAVSDLDIETLRRLEDKVGDLYFELRAARRRDAEPQSTPPLGVSDR